MSELEPVRLRQLVYYFLRLGTLGFGGPRERARGNSFAHREDRRR